MKHIKKSKGIVRIDRAWASRDTRTNIYLQRRIYTLGYINITAV